MIFTQLVVIKLITNLLGKIHLQDSKVLAKIRNDSYHRLILF